MRYFFNGMEFDSERFELTSAGQVLSLRAQPLALLQYLLENRHRLVGKDELVENVWGGRAISDSAIAVTVRSLRVAIGRDLVETVYGRGVKFVGAVTLAQHATVEVATVDETDTKIDVRAGRPSVAVLPFRIVGEEPPQAFLAEALPDDILTALSKLRSLFVIARGSSFQFPSFALTPAEVGARLNVRYCVSGSLELVADRIHVTVEVADTTTDEALWRQHYPLRPGEIHEMRQDVVRKLAAEIDANISSRERERAHSKAPASLNAWEHFHLGLSRVHSADLGRHEEARRHFEQALALEPGFARARAGLANADFLLAYLQEDGAREAAERGLAVARAAVEADPLDPYCNLMLARMDLMQGDPMEGFGRLQRTINLSPSYSAAHSDLARMQVMAGDPQSARISIETALALNPIDPYNHTSFLTLALIEMSLGQFGKAAEAAKKTRKFAWRSVNERVATMMALDLDGQVSAAGEEAREISRLHHGLDQTSFLASLPFLAPTLQSLVQQVFPRYGLSA